LASALMASVYSSTAAVAQLRDVPPVPPLQARALEATCSRSWVGQEAAIEETLRTTKIDRIEVIPIGVTKPKRAFFTTGGTVASAAWKPLRPGMRSGYWESYKSEIAAYELDKLLGMQMV